MTPPDSGERPTHREWCALIVNPQAEKCDCKRKPDSGEREVRCTFFVGDGRCVLPSGHDGRHALLWESAPVAILPLPLAQRILAALEEGWEREQDPHALAAELRACVEGKS